MVCLCSNALPMSYGIFVAGYSGPQWMSFLTWFSLEGREQAANTSIHSELKIAQLFVLLVRPKLVIKFIERKTLFFNSQDQIRNSPLWPLKSVERTWRSINWTLCLKSLAFFCICLLDIINALILYWMRNYKLIFKNWSEYIWLIKKIFCSCYSRPLQH